MVRIGLGILGASILTIGAIALQACSSDDNGAVTPGGGTGGGGGGGGAGGGGGDGGGGDSTGTSSKCVGQCCPTEKTCYSDSTTGNGSPGSECLATQDN